MQHDYASGEKQSCAKKKPRINYIIIEFYHWLLGRKRGTVKAICGQSINSLVSICYNTGVTQTGIVSQWFARHLNFKSKYCKSDTTSPPFKTKSQLPRPRDRADSDVSKNISQIQ